MLEPSKAASLWIWRSDPLEVLCSRFHTCHGRHKIRCSLNPIVQIWANRGTQSIVDVHLGLPFSNGCSSSCLDLGSWLSFQLLLDPCAKQLPHREPMPCHSCTRVYHLQQSGFKRTLAPYMACCCGSFAYNGLGGTITHTFLRFWPLTTIKNVSIYKTYIDC